MKLTSVERIERSQLIPGVQRTIVRRGTANDGRDHWTTRLALDTRIRASGAGPTPARPGLASASQRVSRAYNPLAGVLGPARGVGAAVAAGTRALRYSHGRRAAAVLAGADDGETQHGSATLSSSMGPT